MTTSESHFQFRFRIEEKAGGGFVARSEDGKCTFEGATREEVEGKVREYLVQQLPAEIANKLGEALKPGFQERSSDIHLPGIHITKKVTVKVNTRRNDDDPEGVTLSKTLDMSPKAEAAISPTVVALALLLVGALIVIWRLWPAH